MEQKDEIQNDEVNDSPVQKEEVPEPALEEAQPALEEVKTDEPIPADEIHKDPNEPQITDVPQDQEEKQEAESNEDIKQDIINARAEDYVMPTMFEVEVRKEGNRVTPRIT